MNLFWLIPLLPGVGALLNGVFGIRYFTKRVSATLACTTMAFATVLSILAFVQLIRNGREGL